MKLIFLDIDGVLNNLEDILHEKNLDKPELPQDKHLEILKEIVNKTGAQIILSSGWRLSLEGIQDVINALEGYNLHLRGVTPEGCPASIIEKLFSNVKAKNFDYYKNNEKIIYDRGAEIAFWLCKYSEYEVDSFVIIDDDIYDIKDYYPNNYIKTDISKGLLKEHIKKAIDILGEK